MVSPKQVADVPAQLVINSLQLRQKELKKGMKHVVTWLLTAGPFSPPHQGRGCPCTNLALDGFPVSMCAMHTHTDSKNEAETAQVLAII